MAVIGLMWTVGAGTGCSKELDPTKPDDAYLLFRASLLAGDAEEVWSRCDDTTHRFFQERYETIQAMEADIVRYLPQADHRIARRQSGAILTRDLHDGRGLFLKVFSPKELPSSPAVLLGSELEQVQVAEDGLSALVKTRAGQTFYLSRQAQSGEGAAWSVILSKSVPEAAAAMKWVEENQSALRQTVDDLIAEERAAREAIISDLMKI